MTASEPSERVSGAILLGASSGRCQQSRLQCSLELFDRGTDQGDSLSIAGCGGKPQLCRGLPTRIHSSRENLGADHIGIAAMTPQAFPQPGLLSVERLPALRLPVRSLAACSPLPCCGSSRAPGTQRAGLSGFRPARRDCRQVSRNSSPMPFVYFGLLANRSRWREASVDPSLIALSYHSRA
jgi:hypothetical protein